MNKNSIKQVGTILVLLLAVLLSHAQNNPGAQFIISGTIKDAQNDPIPYANAALYNAHDSTLSGGAVSNNRGKFEISAKPGNYYLKITFLSYREKLIQNISITSHDLQLGNLALTTDSKLMETVIVKGEKSQMKLELDKRVFNVGKDLSNIGANAADVLGNIPSVTIDADGTVSLRGSQNVRILIDGKPSALAGRRSTDALRQLQGNLIESVELITNPSARYDAAGEVGIINIILKKNRSDGLNGTFTVNAGYPAALGSSFNVNYRKNKVNLFSTYGVDYRSNPGRGTSYQKFDNADTSYMYNQKRSITRGEISHNLMVGMDYFLDDNNSITGSLLYSPSDGVNKSRTEYLDFDKNNQLRQSVLRNERESEIEKSIEGSLNYRKKFKAKNRLLTVDFEWETDDDAEKTDYRQTVPGNGFLLQRADNTANERNWLFQTDYIHPFGEQAKMEAGLKSTSRLVKNYYLLEQQDNQGGWFSFPAFNNNMEYTEKIHAAYFMGSGKLNKLSLQGGLRAELSHIKTELTKTKEINSRKYLKIFPSANLSYELNDINTLQLSYSYRINRPEFRDLLPFSDFSDLRSFFKGNPDLNPEFTHSFEAGHLVNWESGSFLSNAYYRYRTGVIQRITTIDSMGIAYIFPVNLATQHAYGLEFNLSLTLNNWWRLNSGINLFRAVTDGNYNNENLHSDTYSGTNRTSTTIRFLKKWDFQASFNYRAPRVTPQGKDLSTYFIDLGISGDVMKGKATVTLNARDLLNSRMRRFIVDNNGYYSRSDFQWRSRQFMLTFSYRLNRMKEEENEKAGEEEEF